MPRELVEAGPELRNDFIGASENVKRAFNDVLPFVIERPGSFGYFFEGAPLEVFTVRYIDIGETHALIWKGRRLLRIVPLEDDWLPEN